MMQRTHTNTLCPWIRGRATHFGLPALLLALTFSGLVGCASPPPAPLVLTVKNNLGRSLSALSQKPCDAPETALKPLPDSALRSGQSRRFVMPPTCVDLVAHDERGRLVGQQRRLTVVQGSRWELHR